MSLQEFLNRGGISRITFTILSELIKRKKRQDQWKRRETAAACFLLVCAGVVILYGFFLHPEAVASLRHLHTLMGRQEVRRWLILCGAALLLFLFCHGKRSEAEDDYDSLRGEIIDRTDELWGETPSETGGDSGRSRVLHFLKRTYDINLFYK